jgi:hypothetical protein
MQGKFQRGAVYVVPIANLFNHSAETDSVEQAPGGANVCMYKGWAIKSRPCTTTFSDLMCFSF